MIGRILKTVFIHKLKTFLTKYNFVYEVRIISSTYSTCEEKMHANYMTSCTNAYNFATCKSTTLRYGRYIIISSA